MYQQSPKLIVEQIHGTQPFFVSWRKENIESKSNFGHNIRPCPRTIHGRTRTKPQRTQSLVADAGGTKEKTQKDPESKGNR